MSSEWYNLNAVRGYPFDERATLASDNGELNPAISEDYYGVFSGGGNAGSITINALGNLTVSSVGGISSDTYGNGNAGKVKLNVTGSLKLLNLRNSRVINPRLSGCQMVRLQRSGGNILQRLRFLIKPLHQRLRN